MLIVIAGVVALVLWQPWQGWAVPAPTGSKSVSVTAQPDPTATSTDAAEADASASDAASDDSSEASDPSASSTDPSIAACTTSDISVQAVTDKDSYGADEQPQLSIMLSNKSDQPCLINVGTAKQSFVITSGSDTWWRSTDCQSDPSDQVVQLDAGQTVSSVTPLAWDRTRSTVDTCDASRSQAPAGYFHLQVSIGGIQGADTKMFQLR